MEDVVLERKIRRELREMEPLAGFRNVVIHEYVGLDLERVVDALRNLDLSSASFESRPT